MQTNNTTPNEITTVVKLKNGILDEAKSFVSYKDAETFFQEEVAKLEPSISNEDIEACLDNGYWDDESGRDIFITQNDLVGDSEECEDADLNDDEQEKYCVTAVFDDEPDANHTKWFTTYEEAKTYVGTLEGANAAVGKRLSLDAALDLIAKGTEVCFIFDDGTESVYEGGVIDEMYVGLPLATYTVEEILTVKDMAHRFPYLLGLDYRTIDLESELEKLGYVIAGHDYVSHEYVDIAGYYGFELEKI